MLGHFQSCRITTGPKNSAMKRSIVLGRKSILETVKIRSTLELESLRNPTLPQRVNKFFKCLVSVEKSSKLNWPIAYSPRATSKSRMGHLDLDF